MQYAPGVLVPRLAFQRPGRFVLSDGSDARADLESAIATAYAHVAPGGVALFAPDCTREKFKSGLSHGGNDGGGRSLRYLQWTHEPDAGGTSYAVDYALILREADGTTRVEHDHHNEGLFSRAEWLESMRAAGFEPILVERQFDDDEHFDLDLFVGSK